LNRKAVGAEIDLPMTRSVETTLFSESPSRVIVSFDDATLGRMEEIAAAHGCTLTLIGRTGGNDLRISVDGQEVLAGSVDQFESAWRRSLSEQLTPDEVLVGAAE
jgi:hypothetical protein